MRDEAVIRHDCEMWALVAELEAANAESAGMLAANTEREAQGKGLAYDEKHFFDMETKFLRIAKKLREL